MYRHLICTCPHSKTLEAVDLQSIVSRFRCGCHGLHVDTGQFKPVEQRVDREQRFCPVFATDTAEDEHHFVFDCPEYCSIRGRFTAVSWGPAPTLSSCFTSHDHRVIAKFLHECFAHRSMLLEGVFGVPQHRNCENVSDNWSNGHGWPNDLKMNE